MRIGPIIASGRDCFIFESTPGKVIRRARDGRSLEWEASIMRHARRNGFPAPEIYDAEGPDILMERIDGVSMSEDMAKDPSLVDPHARLLASLHHQLGAVRAPGWLPAAQGALGQSLLHLDLHPLNVLITADGPVVIDWTNAARGDPAYDVADTWVLFATAEVPGSRFERAVAAVGRRVFLRHFLRGVDTSAARAAIPAAVENRLVDRNMTDGEKDRMRRMAEWATSSSGADLGVGRRRHG